MGRDTPGRDRVSARCQSVDGACDTGIANVVITLRVMPPRSGGILFREIDTMPEPDMSIWTGRVDAADGPDALRWHQMVKPLTPSAEPGVVLVGFACDEGVRRNGGRVGAKDGPRAIRAALANLAWHQSAPVYDAGDVRCDDGDMEGAQSRLAEVVADAIRAGHWPLVLGGGHETAWGTFQGIV